MAVYFNEWCHQMIYVFHHEIINNVKIENYECALRRCGNLKLQQKKSAKNYSTPRMMLAVVKNPIKYRA